VRFGHDGADNCSFYEARNGPEWLHACLRRPDNRELIGEMPMKPSQALVSHREEIRRIVESHRALNARVFGSVVHGADTDDSDLDILIDPTPTTTLMDVAAIQVELEYLLGVKVDVLTPNALPAKFKELVLAEAVSV
jgi:predicted nucleotidyltransferase